ncbi:MAG TPA: lytic murein transglycosylase [Pseudolabrys sp.]|nr:lytic murein transglycosylase [Pseudolabrys sp.]
MLRSPSLSRRGAITGALALLAFGRNAIAAAPSFANWVADFRTQALSHGISAQTYARVMNSLAPDMTVFAQFHSQPEFAEVLWQYVNRRCSDWRVITGKERAKEYADLLARIEKAYGVDRYIMLGLWGMESSFGDLVTNPKYMRPVIPALAALAWREPRRRRYWEAELLNALTIVDKGWAQPAEMIGSWAGAMGHTQWMPEVWLHMGVDFDRDGRISPFGRPDDALAGTARYLVERGGYRRGEAWGFEVTVPSGEASGWRTYEQWRALGVRRPGDKPFLRPADRAKLWIPVRGGPAFLVGRNFYAVRSYNPSTSYTLALCHLGDLIAGGPSFYQQFPGGERRPTLAEVKEIQRRLNERGFKTDGIDGRTGSDTVKAIIAFQKKVGMKPADGYAGLKVLARLRQAG